MEKMTKSAEILESPLTLLLCLFRKQLVYLSTRSLVNSSTRSLVY